MTPAEFAERYIGPLYPWQREMLERLEKMTPKQRVIHFNQQRRRVK